LPLLNSIPDPDTNCADESLVNAHLLLSLNVAYYNSVMCPCKMVMAMVDASNWYPSTLL